MNPSHGNGRRAQPRQTWTNSQDNQTSDSHDPTLYANLLTAGHADGLKTIHTELVQAPRDDNGQVAIVKAIIETDHGDFTAYGDASPESVDADFQPHLLRCAETRAKARALRDALGIGIVSQEELIGDASPDLAQQRTQPKHSHSKHHPPSTQRQAPSRAKPQSRNALQTMTDKQRSLLFRLAYEVGYSKDEAADFLCRELNVGNLDHADRKGASRLIDRLRQGPERNSGYSS